MKKLSTQISKNRIVILLSLFTVFSICFITVGYSLLNTNLSISGDAYVRTTNTIRVKSIQQIESNNQAFETYHPKYTKNTISMFDTFPSIDSNITYQVVIENQTSDLYYIEDIIKVTHTNAKVVYQINGCQVGTKIPAKTSLTFTITLNTTAANQVNDTILKFQFEKLGQTVFNYSYTGSSQTFTPPYSGRYQVELWGAQGGVSGGKGAYTKGEITFKKKNNIYVYVGSKPLDAAQASGGYNGGGNDINGITPSMKRGTGGGGATDIRLTGGTWDNFDSLKSRIMVAAGGGGIGSINSSGTGSGGGLEGATGAGTDAFCSTTGGKQTAGGRYACSLVGIGTFGKGGTNTASAAYKSGGGGGGGYYGGGGGIFSSSYDFQDTPQGGGGSSYISGYTGCNAISSSSTATNIVHTNQPNHYSGFVFTNAVMIGGATSMPSYNGGTMVGNPNNGYARITFLGD